MLINRKKEVVAVSYYFWKHMKQILPKLKQINKHLSFAKKCFTKGGFRHTVNYIDGLITINKKTIRQISKASIDEKDHCAIDRLLREAKFDIKKLEDRYLLKVNYFTKGHYTTLILDDTLNEKEGKKVEQTKRHKDHSSNSFITGHQFFTSIIHTPFLQLPLFPKLYSDETESKIQMAKDTIDKVMFSLSIDCVIFDSWYSDKKIINKCLAKGIKVVCGIKTNRNISLKRGEWKKLSSFSKSVPKKKLENYWIDEIKYKIADYKVKLNGIPMVKMLVSHEYNEKNEKFNKAFHLISTDRNDNPCLIIRQYRIRWSIEVFHRDIKQNLGFAGYYLQKGEGIVRHSIFVTLAYAVLKLFMFFRGLKMTIGECCAYVQDKEMDEFIREIIEIEDKETRIKMFEEVFIRETAQV
ncbi:MAG: transposase [Candidatus Omnitrophota bacterium]